MSSITSPVKFQVANFACRPFVNLRNSYPPSQTFSIRQSSLLPKQRQSTFIQGLNTSMGTQKTKTGFREVVEELDLKHLQVPGRVLSLPGAIQRTAGTTNNSGLFLDSTEDDTSESKMENISKMMAYTACLAFFAYHKPCDFFDEDQAGVKETLVDGSTVHHLNRDALKATVECIVKIQTTSTKIEAVDESTDETSQKTDPYVVFTHGMSMAKCKLVKDVSNSVENSYCYLFIRKYRMAGNVDEKALVDIAEREAHSSGEVEQHYSKSLLQGLNDPTDQNEIPLKLSATAPRGSKPDNVFAKKIGGKNITVEYSTKVLTIDEFLSDLQRNDDSLWMDDQDVESHANKYWKQFFQNANMNLKQIHPISYIDQHSSATQAWFYWNKDEKVLVLAFPGTDLIEEREEDLATSFDGAAVALGDITAATKFTLRWKTEYQDPSARVHEGYKRAYLSVRDTLLETICSITGWSEDWLIIATGHSLGGSLAALGAFEIAHRTTENDKQPVLAMFGFAAPSVGDELLAEQFSTAVPYGFRVITNTDRVAKIMNSPFHRLGNPVPWEGLHNNVPEVTLNEVANRDDGDEGRASFKRVESSKVIWRSIDHLPNEDFHTHRPSSYLYAIRNFFETSFSFMNGQQ